MESILTLESPAFIWMEEVMDYVLYWLIMFLPIILFKIYYVKRKGIKKSKDSMVFTEAIGLPLTFLQPVVFFKALIISDWLGMGLTLWWGPGFLFVVFLVLWRKFAGKKINWGNSGIYISWLCKVYYLAYVALGFFWGMPKLIFALSAWIASDQIEKSFASLDADRSRRSFHDFWVLRIMYPLFLFSPFYFSLGALYKIYGVVLFVLWAIGIYKVYKKGEFFNLPEDPTLLRNMTYFSDKGTRRGK